MTFGARAAAAAVTALTPGPYGLFWRRDVARSMRACGEDVDLTAIHTSCGVDASSWWFAAGRPLHHARASHVGGALIGVPSWIDVSHEAWIAHTGDAHPEVGDIVCYGASLPNVHHVELVIAVHDDGTITTAHGGDSPTYPEILAAGLDAAQTRMANGTVARLGAGPKTLVGVCGWYSARLVAEAEGLDDVKDLSERDTDPGGHAIENEGKA